eukprot:CAMPEP_0118853144 /NCGR_PEP_ID=MMETSP1163-20130328/1844_1 /TAXON_ID=124430 /ORGANISM="Phaeomonas parva, Strain CCMP2877" /LENGTH=333 /DNA_ID=CAMNT_0006785643 /DNA_START=56 /DNA_END=1060 /DNA_ORIENTATION=-
MALCAAPVPQKVVSVGIAGVDLVATLESHPEADAKVRTESLAMLGGGNAGNTATALRRLGVAGVTLLTKVGDDAHGRQVLAELAAEGVDTSRVVVKAGVDTPFTYVIVARREASRTCIHTPCAEELLVADVEAMDVDAVLDGAGLLHLDSRHTAAAVEVARKARARGVPVLIDVEKDRPRLAELLPLADVVVTNAAFPRQRTGEDDEEAALKALLCNHATGAAVAICTMGSRGSLAVRCADRLRPDVSLFGADSEGAATLLCPAEELAPEAIVDTTGAGDAYIAGVALGMLEALPLSEAMALGTRVAWHKLQGAGARSALPTREQVWPAKVNA